MPGARLWLTLIVPLLGASLLAQSPLPSPLDRQLLAGTWTLDKSGPPEDEKNWNRAQRPGSRTTSSDDSDRAGGKPPTPEGPRIMSLSVAGRTQIAPSDTLVLEVLPDAVRIRDDFREATRFDTTGRTISMNVLPYATRALGDYVGSPLSITVRVKASWNGQALEQELWTRDTSEIVRLTRTFIPFDQGRKMLLVIKVLEPKLKDPVKDIERVYVRSQ